ncbi:hypothetical protein [Roseivirga thermotolerans]|uniref:Peptidase S74 domain-containing protein n=1 Tax=Roseivirga thermotolerans TaxID=1758176 RepID=A0ABQ3I1X9_9BACT|nr:hypothetical protein [Roseivirga thermotolerans]GHE56682.1 hypothetical protein GCM10011340_09550 [Roseivirga thermotolerans]
MKKTLLSAIVLFINSFMLAQSNTFPSSGNVGIGTSSPAYKLDVKGSGWIGNGLNDGIYVGTGNHAIWTRTGNTLGKLVLFSGNADRLTIDGDNGYVGIGTSSPTKLLEVNGDTRIGNLTSRNYLKLSSSLWPEVRFQTPSNDESIRLGMAHSNDSNYGIEVGDFYVWSDLVNQMPLIVRRNGDLSLSLQGGNVGIGMSSPNEKLEVNGTIRSKKVKVEATGWPDYVFSSHYKLRPLKELEQFVQQNQHLPEVPSAKEIEANGQDLGDIQVVLLKKIEELTLYLIQENNENSNLKEQITRVEGENQELREVLEELKKEIEAIKNQKQ